MKKIINHLLAFVILLTTSSCATMFSHKESKIRVESNKPLKVEVNAEKEPSTLRTTPFTFVMSRRKGYTFKVVSDNYESEEFQIGTNLRWGFMILNAFTPFFSGYFIDFASGKIYEHSSSYLYIDTDNLELKKAQAEANGKDDFIAELKFRMLGTDENEADAETQGSVKVKFHKV